MNDDGTEECATCATTCANCKQIMDRMDTLERKLDLILHKLDGSVIANCDKMGTHIDFVNGVYETVKIPLNYISTKIHRLARPLSSPKELPLIGGDD